MIVSTELENEDGDRVKIEVETAIASDAVQVRIIGGSGATSLRLTRKEASALRTCLSDV